MPGFCIECYTGLKWAKIVYSLLQISNFYNLFIMTVYYKTQQILLQDATVILLLNATVLL